MRDGDVADRRWRAIARPVERVDERVRRLAVAQRRGRRGPTSESGVVDAGSACPSGRGSRGCARVSASRVGETIWTDDDLGVGHRRAPVGEQVGDRVVELLVAHAARHQQEGVVLARGHARPQAGGVGEEALPVRGDHAGGRWGRPRATGGTPCSTSASGSTDSVTNSATWPPSATDLVGDARRPRAPTRGADVVVARVAAELVEQRRRRGARRRRMIGGVWPRASA